MRFCFSIMFLLITLQGFCQKQGYRIYGNVADETKLSLPGAIVQLYADSNMVAGCTTDSKGNYILKEIPSGTYKLTVSFLGFRSYTTTVNVKHADISMMVITLKEATNYLQEVAVIEKALPVTQKDDTLEYSSAAYKVNADADAAALIKKLPGMELQNGTVMAQGENVTKIVVDGKPFFTTDPYAALKNLPAEMVDKIQVYNEKSDQEQFTGFNEGNTTKTINLVTHKDKRHGILAKATAGGAQDDKYMAGASLNKFNGDKRFTVTAHANDIGLNGSSDVDGMPVPQAAGQSRDLGAGINYNDQWGTKTDVSISYNNSFTNTAATSNTYRTYLTATDSGQSYTEKQNTSSVAANQNLNIRLNYIIDTFNSILFTPQVSFHHNSGRQSLFEAAMNNNDVYNNTNTYNDDAGKDNALNAAILYRHKFKNGNSFSINITGTSSNNMNTNNAFSESVFSDTPLSKDSVAQQNSGISSNHLYSANANYTAISGKYSRIQLQYQFSDAQSGSYKTLYTDNDFANGNKTLDSTKNVFATHNTLQKFGGTYQYQRNKFLFSLGLYYQAANTLNTVTETTSGSLSKQYGNLLPAIVLQYKFSRKSNLHFNYSTSTILPAAMQLQNIVNNTNPLFLYIGNPSLRQSYTHTLTLRFTHTNAAHTHSLSGTLAGTYTQQYVSNNNTIAANDSVIQNGVLMLKGAQLTTPVNVNGCARLNGYLSYSAPVTSLKSNFSINLNAGMAKTPVIVEQQVNYMLNKNAGANVTLSSNISENIDFTLSSISQISNVANTFTRGLSNIIYSENAKAVVTFNLQNNFIFNSELSYQSYSGIATTLPATSFLLWNIGLGKKIFRHKQGDIHLYIYDALNQNRNVQHTVTETYVENTTSNVLSRYLMLTFTYKLKNFNK